MQLLLIEYLLVKHIVLVIIHHGLDLLTNLLLLQLLLFCLSQLLVASLDIIVQLLQLFVRELVKVEFELLLIALVVLWLVLLHNGEDTAQLLVL
jgi:hypothetical protein